MDYTIGRAKLDPWSKGLTTWFGPLPSSFSLGLMLVGILQLNFCIWEKKTHHPSWGLRRETASVCGGSLVRGVSGGEELGTQRRGVHCRRSEF